MHPGQITFFEYKDSHFGKSLLATSNESLKEIYIWDLYGRGNPGLLDYQVSHNPNMILNPLKGYEFENIKWSNTSYQMYSTLKNESIENDFKFPFKLVGRW